MRGKWWGGWSSLRFKCPDFFVREFETLGSKSLVCHIQGSLNYQFTLQIRKANNALEETIGSIPNPKRFRRGEIQFTKQILVVIGAFIICNICTVAVAIKARTHNFQSHTHLLVSISDLFITLNCSLNVIIYGIFNPKFRATFKKMFCSCFKKKSEAGKPVFHISSMSKKQSRLP